MAERKIVPASSAVGLRLARGQHLRIIDIEGGQTGDLMAFAPDGRERLSNGCSFDYNGKIQLSTGDVLWSDRSTPMLTIIEDNIGRHDFLYAACRLDMYRIQYGVSGYHPNCHDNLLAALRELQVTPDSLPTTFNFFMRSEVGSGGRLSIVPPTCRAGDSMVFRAEMDLAIALSACPATACNGSASPRPLAFEVT